MNAPKTLASDDFLTRAEKARSVPALHSFSNAANDLIRIAAFAGFDVKELVRRAVLRSRRGRKINVATVENEMGRMSQK